jgi:hypothetical protein
MKKRLKDKFFITAAAGFIYQIIEKYGAHWGIHVDLGLYQMGVDLFTYAAIGVCCYKTFDDHSDEDKGGE